MEEIKKAAATLGRKGGQVKSEKKAQSSRDNGKLGGRPPKKLRMGEIITQEGYENSTADERRKILKYEQAKEYSGFRKYPDTCKHIFSFIPDDLINRMSAKDLGEIAKIINRAYQAGKNEKR
jgi:hypothetical protein